MERTTEPNAAADLHGAGKDGYTEGEPGVTEPTTIGAVAMNEIQESLVRIEELAGFTLGAGNYDRIRDCVLSVARMVTVGGSGAASGAKLPLTTFGGPTTIALASDELVVPTKGLYLVSFLAECTASPTTNPQNVSVDLHSPNAVLVPIKNKRFSASAADSVLLSGTAVAYINDVADHVWVTSSVSNLTCSGYLSVVRLHAIP